MVGNGWNSPHLNMIFHVQVFLVYLYAHKMPVKEQESSFKRFQANFCDFFVFANFDLRDIVTD